jgi:hypothetical protein
VHVSGPDGLSLAELGRLYPIGVLVGCIGAAYIGAVVSPVKAFGISLEFLALAWFVTALMAYIAVLRRQFAAHRERMIRSYVVTFGFVLFRMARHVQLFSGLEQEMPAVMLASMIWAVPLLITDVVLRWRQTLGPSKRVSP